MIPLLFENLKISLGAVFANKSRSILTALGIVIGVLSVTLMGTLISGLDRSFENSMSWLGKDILPPKIMRQSITVVLAEAGRRWVVPKSRTR